MFCSQIQNYLMCLLHALSHVHKFDYIHRDVKPSNFLYNLKLNTGVLIDFGLAQKQPSSKDCEEARLKVKLSEGFSYYPSS